MDSFGTLYVVGSGVYASTSSGMNIIYGGGVTAFALDPSAPGTIYVAGSPSAAGNRQAPFPTGIFKSTNGGTSWKPVAAGPIHLSMLSMAVDPTGRLFHIGTGLAILLDKGDGVFDLEFSMPTVSPVIPIVLDVETAAAHYTTELTLTNNTTAPQPVNLVYTASLGTAEGSGTVSDLLMPGEQRRIEDVVAFLREKGLAIPSKPEPAGQGGTLRVETPEFAGAGRIEALARTATGTRAPLPAGRAGLAYNSVEVFPGHPALRVFGLRSSEADRSNLAVVNTSASPMTVRITVFSGSGDGRSAVVREGQTLPPYGWIQVNSPELLEQFGIMSGWALVERTSELGVSSMFTGS